MEEAVQLLSQISFDEGQWLDDLWLAARMGHSTPRDWRLLGFQREAAPLSELHEPSGM